MLLGLMTAWAGGYTADDACLANQRGMPQETIEGIVTGIGPLTSEITISLLRCGVPESTVSAATSGAHPTAAETASVVPAAPIPESAPPSTSPTPAKATKTKPRATTLDEPLPDTTSSPRPAAGTADPSVGILSICCLMAAFGFFPYLGFTIGAPKGRWAEGIFWAGLLGPLGLIIIAVYPAKPLSRAQKSKNLRARIEEEERIRAEVRAKMERDQELDLD